MTLKLMVHDLGVFKYYLLQLGAARPMLMNCRLPRFMPLPATNQPKRSP